MLNRRGDINSIVKIILTVIVLIILYNVFTYGYTTFITSEGSKEACKNWVNLQSISALKEFHSFESSCVTTEDTIKNVKTENEIYKKLADNMYDCWDEYGQGESDFYSDLITFENGLNAPLYCRVCSEIKIDPSLEQSKRSVDIDKFEEYLTNNHPPGTRETYAEFFTKADNAKLNFGSGNLELNPDKKLYIMFTAYKGKAPTTLDQLKDIGGYALESFGLGAIIQGRKGISIKGLKGNLIFGLGLTAIRQVATYTYLYPGLLLVSNDEVKDNFCSSIYYKPINSNK